jgi:hypothetical protein
VIVRAQAWIEPVDVGGVVIDQEVTVKTIRFRPQQRGRSVGKEIGMAM